MSRQIGFLYRYLSYPSNHQRHSSRISLSDLISSPLPTSTTKSPRMDSVDTTQTNFSSISNFNKSNLDTPDEFRT